jgi:hypothetical protein
MAQKISDFTEKSTGLTADAFLPIIDKNLQKDNLYENYKLNIVEYFYSKSEIDDKISAINKSINENVLKEENNNLQIKTEVLNYIQNIENELNSKQNKILNDKNRVVITNNNSEIAISNITNTELNSLDNITGNIENRLQALSAADTEIFEKISELEKELNLIYKLKTVVDSLIGAPDPSRTINVKHQSGSTYVCPENGYIQILNLGNEYYFSGYITYPDGGNINVVCGGAFTYYHETDTVMIPVVAGCILTNTSGGRGTSIIRFIPSVKTEQN